jgi:uncharacterized surface protein with fasciclin (FAS1) repeats
MVGCKKEFSPDSKYNRPDWLAGKVYTQIKDQPELSTFAKCLEITGFDTIINTSGSYTVFAPNNTAFDTYLKSKQYNSVEDIPVPFLTQMVKYMIVQDPWSKAQLESLDVYGWIDSTDLNNNKPRGFKRETLLKEPDKKYWVTADKNRNISIVDSANGDWYRKVFTDARKFAPIFFKKYLDISNLTSSDFSFYFDRPFDSPDDLYFAGAKIIGDEIFAENGFIYNIDRVVEPLKNAEEILSTEKDGQSYSDFLDLIHLFPEFTYNFDETYNQPGAAEGKKVDSLFGLSYPLLAFDISNEKTKPPLGTFGLPQNVTIRYHHGMVAPTNQAFEQFISDYITVAKGWGSLKNAPEHIKRIIANTHMSVNAIYPSDFGRGFFNGEKDYVTVDENSIVQKEFGSNCTFIGVNKAIVPRAFSSVTGPVYIQQGYSKVMYAIEKAGLLAALKRSDANYMFLVESDRNLSQDSSLVYNPITEAFSLYLVAGSSALQKSVTVNDLRTLLLNHIGTVLPTGNVRKEFIRNLAGNYLVVNNQTGEVSGTAPTTIGYRGLMKKPNFPVKISQNSDNGNTYEIDNWLSFTTANIYSNITSKYPYFHNLLKKAGFDDSQNNTYKFLSDNEFYTVFVPTQQAITAFGADTLSGQALKNFLLLHFIQGNIIFTDGRATPGYYETARVDERSTVFSTIYTKIYIDPEPDMIKIRDKSGNNYVTINESDSTNIIAGISLGDGTATIENTFTSGVIHQINKVLTVNDVDTN